MDRAIVVEPLAGHGGVRDQDSKTTLGRGADYLTARIKRDRPDIAERMQRGEFRSVRAAAINARLVEGAIGRKLSAACLALPATCISQQGSLYHIWLDKDYAVMMLAAQALAKRAFTPTQVAAMFNLQTVEVNNLLREVVTAGAATVGHGKRTIPYKSLPTILVAKDLIDYGIKRQLRIEAISAWVRKATWTVTVPGTHLTYSASVHKDTVHKRALALVEAESSVMSKPDIMRGEPCIAGTRVPVYMIADIAEADGRAEVRRAYPQLTAAQIEQAILYAKACPRRGRPRQVRLKKGAKPLSRRTVKLS